MAAHVVQEGARAEVPAGGECATDTKGGREAHEEALAMIEGERGVDRLARLDAEELGERHATHGEPEMADDCRLRVARGARGIDVEEHVTATDLGDVGLGRGPRPLAERPDIAGKGRG